MLPCKGKDWILKKGLCPKCWSEMRWDHERVIRFSMATICLPEVWWCEKCDEEKVTDDHPVFEDGMVRE